MISVDNVAVEFNGGTLFSDITFNINEKDKIALMGKNGAGKSTLLKIIAGVDKPTRGKISAPKDAVIAYLPQHLLTKDDSTVFEEASKAFSAAGFLDLGEKSSAGISCFYDPEYRKYSLGKYLMYLKMEFCKQNGFHFFYPGYFAPDYPLFDYKLDLAKPSLQYLDLVADAWIPFEEFDSSRIPINLIVEKLRILSEVLDSRGVKNDFKFYDFFDADMIHNLNGMGLLDFPVFLFCFDIDSDSPLLPMVIYDVRDEQFHLILCTKVYKSIFEEAPEEHYNAYLLQISRFLYTGEVVEEMADVIEMYGQELLKEV